MVNKYFKGRLMNKFSSEQLFKQKPDYVGIRWI